MFTIKIGKLPGLMKEVASNDPISVADAAASAEIDNLDGYSVRVNGNPASMDTTLSTNAQVVFVRNVKGA